jgi:membrane dipeptidase
MIVFDAHEDIAWNAITFGRDYTQGAQAIRQHEQETGAVAPKVNGAATLGLPEWLRGRVGVIVATAFISPAHRQAGAWDTTVYHTPGEASSLAHQQIDYYERLADTCERVELVRTRAELDAVLATWDGYEEPENPDEPQAEDARRLGFILSIEGADPIIEPAQLEEWCARGVRAVGPAWVSTRYAGGTGEPGPLTDLGHELLEVMASFGVALDLSHIAEEAYFQALERYEGPAIVASHSNPRRFCPSDRGLSDEMIAAMADRNGVIGVVLYNGFLKPGWHIRHNRKDEVCMADVTAAIDHICQVTGSARHVGIGSDFDGGFGYAHIPAELDTVADLLKIGAALGERGYSDEDIAAVLGGNFLRAYGAALDE